MERKHAIGLGLVLLVIAAVFVYPRVRWGVYAMAVDETVLKEVPRFATPEQVLAIADKLKDVGATRYRLDRAKLQVDVRFVAKEMGPGGVWWYMHATVKYGSNTIEATPRRVEGTVGNDYLQALEAGGIPVTRPG